MPVLGWKHEWFPAFYTRSSGLKVPHQVQAASEVADILLHRSRSNTGVLLTVPIPVEAEATVQDKVVAMYDKGKAAVVVTEAETKLKTGELLWTTRSSVFIRGEGGWDGDRGPSGPQNEPPAKAPDHEVTLQTSPDQAFVYRLSGDRNPLHCDPDVATAAGFPKPILHGLCTYGITCRAVLQALGLR